jgi:hypothetical protein
MMINQTNISENKFLNQSKSSLNELLPRIDSIKQIRQKIGITQKKLGQKSAEL